MPKSEFAKRLEELIKAGDKLVNNIRKDTQGLIKALGKLKELRGDEEHEGD